MQFDNFDNENDLLVKRFVVSSTGKEKKRLQIVLSEICTITNKPGELDIWQGPLTAKGYYIKDIPPAFTNSLYTSLLNVEISLKHSRLTRHQKSPRVGTRICDLGDVLAFAVFHGNSGRWELDTGGIENSFGEILSRDGECR